MAKSRVSKRKQPKRKLRKTRKRRTKNKHVGGDVSSNRQNRQRKLETERKRAEKRNYENKLKKYSSRKIRETPRKKNVPQDNERLLGMFNGNNNFKIKKEQNKVSLALEQFDKYGLHFRKVCDEFNDLISEKNEPSYVSLDSEMRRRKNENKLRNNDDVPYKPSRAPFQFHIEAKTTFKLVFDLWNFRSEKLGIEVMEKRLNIDEVKRISNERKGRYITLYENLKNVSFLMYKAIQNLEAIYSDILKLEAMYPDIQNSEAKNRVTVNAETKKHIKELVDKYNELITSNQ